MLPPLHPVLPNLGADQEYYTIAAFNTFGSALYSAEVSAHAIFAQELGQLAKGAPEGVKAGPKGDDMLQWEGEIKGDVRRCQHRMPAKPQAPGC